MDASNAFILKPELVSKDAITVMDILVGLHTFRAKHWVGWLDCCSRSVGWLVNSLPLSVLCLSDSSLIVTFVPACG